MVLVALAGGTSPTLGRSLVTAITQAGRHTPIILSRLKPGSASAPTSKYGASIRYVEYTSIPSLATALQGVHTVISVLNSMDPTEMVTHHSNLLKAAVQAGCKRFAPSEWEGGALAKQGVDGMACKLDIWEQCLASGLECARFTPGWFMNYLGQGCPREEALKDDFMLEYIDIAKGKVIVPLTDEGRPAKTSMTELGDIGRFVAAALDLEDRKWEAEMGMVGSTEDLERVAREAERVTGRKFEVEFVTKRDLKERENELERKLKENFSVNDLFRKLCAQFMQGACDEQVGKQVIDPVLNKLCPEVKPMNFEEYLEWAWST